MNEGQDLWEICDERSEELSDMYKALYDADSKPKQLEFTDGDYGDILYIREAHLEPHYRGYSIGLLAVDRLIRSLPSFEMESVVLYLAGTAREARELCDTHDHATVQQKLIQYWSLLDVRVWGRTSGANDIFLGTWTCAGRVDVKSGNNKPYGKISRHEGHLSLSVGQPDASSGPNQERSWLVWTSTSNCGSWVLHAMHIASEEEKKALERAKNAVVYWFSNYLR